MKTILLAVLASLRSTVRSRTSMQLEILALRHQLAVYQRSAKRLRLKPADRILWSFRSSLAGLAEWPDDRPTPNRHRLAASAIPRPLGAALPLWEAGTTDRGERSPRSDQADVRRQPARGAPRIVGELRKIGIEVAKSTVERYRIRPRRPASPTWMAFLKTHAAEIISIDFFVVPNVKFEILFVFLILAHDRRRILHVKVTTHPSAEWTAQQIVEAFPWSEVPAYLLRDRDSIYGAHFQRRVKSMGIEEVVIARRSPWQNPYVERLIGSIRRECLDHVIVLNELHLKRVLKWYFAYYHGWRTHRSLDMDAPAGRPIQPQDHNRVVEIPEVGGLHHHYERRAA